MNRCVIAIFILILSLSSCSKPLPPPPPPPKAITVKPVKKDVPLYLDYVGHIEAYKTVNLQAQVAGTLTGMYFEEGSVVKEGELLFTIDSRPYIAALEQAEANFANSLAALKYSEETARRYAKLAQEEYVSKLQYDQYLTSVLEDDANVKAAIANIATAKINLSYCTLYAPMNAVAGKKEIDVGNYITVGENTPLIVLNQMDPIYAGFYVPDNDLPTIQKYQRASGPLKSEVFFYQDHDKIFEGNLTLIDNQVDESTGTVYMKVTLPNSNLELWPGEFVDVRIILKMLPNAILVPKESVQYGQTGTYVYTVSKDNILHLVNVTAGQLQGDMIVIESGLTGDETVVTQGQLGLIPGQKVTPQMPTAASSNPSTSFMQKQLHKRNRKDTSHLKPTIRGKTS